MVVFAGAVSESEASQFLEHSVSNSKRFLLDSIGAAARQIKCQADKALCSTLLVENNCESEYEECLKNDASKWKRRQRI